MAQPIPAALTPQVGPMVQQEMKTQKPITEVQEENSFMAESYDSPLRAE